MDEWNLFIPYLVGKKKIKSIKKNNAIDKVPLIETLLCLIPSIPSSLYPSKKNKTTKNIQQRNSIKLTLDTLIIIPPLILQ